MEQYQWYCQECDEEGQFRGGLFLADEVDGDEEDGRAFCPIHGVPLFVVLEEEEGEGVEEREGQGIHSAD